MPRRPKMVRSTYEQESFVHRALWHTVTRLAELPAADARYTRHVERAGLMLAACAIESFANFMLSVVDEPALADERERFGGHGATGKLEHVAALVGLVPNRGARPFQTLAQLQDLRNDIAHPKPEVETGERHHSAEREPPMFSTSRFDKKIDSLPLARVIEDAAAFCDQLQAAVQKWPKLSAQDHSRIHGDALSGLLGIATWSSKVVE